MSLITGYILFGVVVLVAVAYFFFAVPALRKGLDKFEAVVNVAVQMVRAIEQEFKSEAPDPNDPDYEAKKAAYNVQKKLACREAILEVLAEFKLPIPSNEVIDKAIEIGVFIMNEGKKLLEKK